MLEFVAILLRMMTSPLGRGKDPGPEGPALVHPGFRLVDPSPTGRRVEPKSLQLGERGDMDDYLCQQCSARPGATADVKLDPLCIERSKPYLADTYETRSGPGVSGVMKSV